MRQWMVGEEDEDDPEEPYPHGISGVVECDEEPNINWFRQEYDASIVGSLIEQKFEDGEWIFKFDNGGDHPEGRPQYHVFEFQAHDGERWEDAPQIYGPDGWIFDFEANYGER